jgi:hypothetical protein
VNKVVNVKLILLCFYICFIILLTGCPLNCRPLTWLSLSLHYISNAKGSQKHGSSMVVEATNEDLIFVPLNVDVDMTFLTILSSYRVPSFPAVM